MRKIIFIAFWAMLMIMPAVGQVTFGVRAGGAYSSLVQKVEGTYNAGARFGFSLAGLADIHLYKGLSLRPELAFVNQGGSFYSNPQVEGAKNSFNKCSYYSIQVYAGPTLDFSLFGKMKTENQNVDIHFGQTKEADLKTFDLGVNVGLRVDYSRYFFSVSALCGTLDRRAIEREGESSLYQNNVTLSLGYMFR